MRKYFDIIALPHREPRNRIRMPQQNRAAQFAPFAALTGLDGEMAETARLTDRKRELCEFERNELNAKLNILLAKIADGEQPTVFVTYFVPDKKKKGGKYVGTDGTLRRIDELNRCLVFTDIPPVKINALSEIIIK